MSEFHGHAVIDFLRQHSCSLVSLKAHYAPDDRFHTCKLSDLTLDELIEFLLKANKLSLNDEKLTVNDSEICNH